VRFLTQRLDAALVVDPVSIKSTKVQFGATLEVLDEEGNIKIYSIVGVDEVDTAKGRISWQSPIGKSLIGRKEGDEVLVKIPAGEVTLEIVKITYHPIE
jgi:transcription elongation factor GreB